MSPNPEPNQDEAAEGAEPDGRAAGTPDTSADRSSPLAGMAPWIAAVLGGVGGLGALGYLRGRYQHSTTFLPDEAPDGGWDPDSLGIESEDVWFETPDGCRLHGWWIEHPDPAGCVLYCHGSSGSITHRVEVFRALGSIGLEILAFDYRGYGQSEGTPSEKGLCTDVRAAHRYLERDLGRAPGETLLFGHSLGGAVAIDAARDVEAAGLVVEASFTDVKDMARAFFPQLPLHLIAKNGFRSVDKVAGLELPKLFIHGTADHTVPFELGLRLYEAAAPPKELYTVQGAGHNDLHSHAGGEYVRRLARFARLAIGR